MNFCKLVKLFLGNEKKNWDFIIIFNFKISYVFIYEEISQLGNFFLGILLQKKKKFKKNKT